MRLEPRYEFLNSFTFPKTTQPYRYLLFKLILYLNRQNTILNNEMNGIKM